MTDQNRSLISREELGKAANHFAARNAFRDYRERKAKATIRRQDAGLDLFAEYLEGLGMDPGNLAADPESWRGITWGLVKGFARWLLKEGYAVSTVNVRLSTVKTYAKLAFKSGSLPREEFALIQAVEGYSRKERKRIDEQRDVNRVGDKKPDPTPLSQDQAERLRDQDNTPQGKRDALILSLMLDLGLRVSEVHSLTQDNFNLEEGTLEFYREKVDMIQTHNLNGALEHARAYIETKPQEEPFWHGSNRQGKLLGSMSKRAMSKRVRYLGREKGILELSPHDLRHHWATQAAQAGTPIDRLQDAGGWSSPSMPLLYIEQAKIANEGVKLE